ncbi:MAG: hypothetical protein NVSMB62_18180 [Acidobacteriaceae bacterium]
MGFVCLGVRCGVAQTSAAPAVAAKPVITCMVNRAHPDAADTAYNRKEYAGAEKLFRDMLAVIAHDESAHEGLIRDLIQQNRVAEAGKEADAWAAAEPASAMAMVAVGEARLREGIPKEAFVTFIKAAVMDPCNPRARYGQFRVNELRGAFASAKSSIEQAYRLHPTDEEIHTSWIWTRDHKDRMELFTDYVGHTDQINDQDREEIKRRLEKESLYRPTDCRVSPSSPARATVPMQPLMDGPKRFVGWGLDVQFNGKRRRLQIDTGASGLTISRSAALFLGIRREDEVQTGGIGDSGKVRTSVAHVASVKIGALEFTNCPVEILEKWSALDSEGLIGADVFDRSAVALDFPKHELRVEPLPERPEETKSADAAAGVEDEETSHPHDAYVSPEMTNWLRIYRLGHELLVPAAVADTKKAREPDAWKGKLFLLDTGAALNFISPVAAAEVTKVSLGSDIAVRGISGSVNKVYEAGSFSLAFAGLKLESPSMTAIDLTDLSHGTGVEVSGLIGAPALFQLVMHIDYRDNLIWCEYHPTP